VINFSIMQTMTRSIITSLTVVFTLLALFLFGGFSMRNVALALLVGIISGTYSSIFNASQIVSLWQELEDRLRHRATATA
jgi:preprotein translocase subunit SecF